MKYLCLVYHEVSTAAACPDEARAYDDDLRQRGHLLAAHTLESDCAATVIRMREGRLFIDDNACTATRAQLTGYYLIEAWDLNEAIRLASRHPSARLGRIELRPVKDATSR
ncbi:MAG: YciI family protein [Thermomicrobiales bacterium]